MVLRRSVLLGALTALLPASAWAAEPVSPLALKAFALIDGLDVEHNWPAGVHVNWRTGVPDGRPEKLEGKHTHCSAFAAAAAESLGIYLLRPPDHGQMLLANAQYDWLLSQGAAQGWQPIRTMAQAQDAANQGMFAVAVYHNRNDDRPGHIAIIRPGAKSPQQLAAEGPDVTQAGGTNYRSASLKQGFAGHPRAWKNQEFLLFAHAIDAKDLN